MARDKIQPNQLNAINTLAAEIDATPKQKKKRKPTKTPTQQLVELGTAECELWHSGDEKGYATCIELWKPLDPNNGHQANYRITSKRFSQWLRRAYFAKYNKPLTKTFIAEAKEHLEGQALMGAYHSVYHRVARQNDTIYIDLGNPEWECVEITADGWRIIKHPPEVKFIRSNNTGQFPIPVRGGDINLLRPFLCPDEQNWTLIKGFMLDCFKGHHPYFILSVNGREGSGKTLSCRFIKRVVDPVKSAELSASPRDIRSLAVAVQDEMLIGFENVSFIPQWLSDMLCAIATGGGFKERSLYTDDDITIIEGARPIILNGIPVSVERNDLLSRALLIDKPPIPKTETRTERELYADFHKIHAEVLGGLLDMLVSGLVNEKNVRMTSLPRMADSVKWITACFGDDAFIKAYEENEREAVRIGIERSAVARCIIKTLSTTNPMYERGVFEGTITQLIHRILDTTDYVDRGSKFPDNPATFGRQFSGDVKALESVGIRAKIKNKMSKVWRIEYTEE